MKSGFKLHKCHLQPKNVEITLQKEDSENASHWKVNFYRLATEKDLESNHHIEELDETIWSMSAKINFCPFCGEKLNDIGRKYSEFFLYTFNDFKPDMQCIINKAFSVSLKRV